MSPAAESDVRDAGQVIADRFEILRKLGAGGFGAVFEVLDRQSEERVALKELRRMEAASLYRFKQEFRSLADINHPNLIELGELHGAGERWFFTMELVDGTDFSSYIRPAPAMATAKTIAAISRSSLPTVEDPYSEHSWIPPENRFELDESRLRAVLLQLVSGVMALHAAGKLHCDLKPSNVLVDRAGRLVILDFGLVTDARDGGLQDHLQVAGTPIYMSPEQIRAATLSPASDWYSIGIMLFEVLTGSVPHQGDSITDILTAKLVGDVPDPRWSTAGIPDDLAELCVGLTRLGPAERIAGAELLARLQGGAPAPPAAPYESWSRALELHAIVGRERELEMLHAAHQRLLRDRKAHAVHLRGASGMGKTALLRRFLRELRGKTAIVLEGRCYEREAVPYNAFDSMIDALTRHLARLEDEEVTALVTPDLHALARIFPVLENVRAIADLAGSTIAAPDPHRARARAFRALRLLLDRLARRAPIVLSMDDLHWGDADSAALLEDVLRGPEPPPLLVIASYRTDARTETPLLNALGAVPALEIELGPLSEEDACSLAAGLLGETESQLSAELIARESGGSPLFVTELVRYARMTSIETPDACPIDPEALTLDRVLGARIARLPQAARCVLETVATMGEPLEPATALAAAGVTTSRHQTLAALRRADLLKRSANSSEEWIEMFHDRVRDAVLNRLAPEARRARHLELAEALARSHRADPEALARHYLAAGAAERAAHYSVLAADRASAAFAFDRAVVLYRTALELAEPDRRRKLRVRLADALVNAGRGAEAAAAYLAAVQGSDRHEAIDLRRRAAEHLLRSGRIDQGVATLRSVLSEVGLEPPATPLGVLLSIIGGRVRLKLRGLRSVLRSESELEPDVLLRADTCASAALGLAMVDVIRGFDFQTRHLLLALDAGEPTRLAVSLAIQAMNTAGGGARGRAQSSALLERARELAARIDQPYVDALLRAAGGVSAFIGGRFAEARAELANAEQIFGDRCVGTDFHRVTVQLFSIAACFYLGELRELGERVGRYLVEAEQRGDLYARVNLQLAAGNMAWLARDEPEEARKRASEALAAWSRDGYLLQHWYALRSIAQIDLYQGRASEAYERTAREWRPLTRSLIARPEHIFVETRQLRGRVALAAAANPGHPHALSEAEHASKQLLRVREPWSESFGRLLEAGIASRRGNRSRAVKLFRESIALCEKSELRLYAAAARRRLGELVSAPDGEREYRNGTEFLLEQGIVAPERFTQMLVPA